MLPIWLICQVLMRQFLYHVRFEVSNVLVLKGFCSSVTSQHVVSNLTYPTDRER